METLGKFSYPIAGEDIIVSVSLFKGGAMAYGEYTPDGREMMFGLLLGDNIKRFKAWKNSTK